jgi:DsbC/DsbD-like thiol-disulfide interchange protein
MKFASIAGLATIAILLLVADPCGAQAPSGSQPETVFHARAELIPEALEVQAGRPFQVGVHFVIDRGWHVNWRNPGDAGLAPSVKWDLPPGFTAGPIEWPAPELILEPSLAGYGYRDEVLLPVTITPPAQLGPGRSAVLRADVNWLECNDVCVPGKATLQLTLGVTSTPPAPNARFEQLYSVTSRRLPRPAVPGTFTCRITALEIVLEGTQPVGTDLDSVHFFPFERGVVENAAPQRWSIEGERLTVHLVRPANHMSDPARLEGVLYTVPALEGPGSPPALSVSVPVSMAGGAGSTLRLFAVAAVIIVGVGWLAVRRRGASA